MVLRGWKREDLQKISEIEKQCFSDPWKTAAFEDVCSHSFCSGILLEENGEIVGYACVSVLFQTADLLNIAVQQSFRRRGIGQKLLDGVFALIKERGAQECFLEVRVSNQNAKRLYERNGFLPVNVRKGYYPDGEDALVMRKEFSAIER